MSSPNDAQNSLWGLGLGVILFVTCVVMVAAFAQPPSRMIRPNSPAPTAAQPQKPPPPA